MSVFTNLLNLFKWEPEKDGEEEFDIDKALNDNWDKLDNKIDAHTKNTQLVHKNATADLSGFMSKEDKEKLDNIEKKAQSNIIEKIQKNGKDISIIDKIVNLILDKSDIGLDQVDNTADLDKPISNLTKKALENKVDKEKGKGLSSNDFTDDDKKRLIPSGGVAGQVLIKKTDTDYDVEWENQTGGGNATGDTVPISSIIPYPKATPLENWLICDGSAVSRTDYSELFNVIGTEFGEGDGSTTFNLPNIKGRTIVGLDVDDTDFNTIGKKLGEKAHTLTVAEMPEHTHKFRASANLGNDEGTITYGEKTSGNIISGNYGNAIQKEGSSQSHNNIQPSFVGVYIIKAKQSAGLVATVVDSLDSTSATDALSAKQGKNLKEKIEKKDNFIIVGIFDNLSLSNTTNKIVFNKTLEHNGNLLTLNTNGEVVVGAGITKIEVSSAVFLEDFGGTGYSWAKIFKNDIQVTSAIVPVQQGIYQSASVASKAINVSEGDKIMLKVENSTSAKIRAGDAATFMCVKVIA